MRRSIRSSSHYFRHWLKTDSLRTPKQQGPSAMTVAARRPCLEIRASSPKVSPSERVATWSKVFSSSETFTFFAAFSRDFFLDSVYSSSIPTDFILFKMSSLRVYSFRMTSIFIKFGLSRSDLILSRFSVMSQSYFLQVDKHYSTSTKPPYFSIFVSTISTGFSFNLNFSAFWEIKSSNLVFKKLACFFLATFCFLLVSCSVISLTSLCFTFN